MPGLPSPESSVSCFHFIGQQTCHQRPHLWMLLFILYEWRCFMLHRCFVDASCCVLGHIGAISPSLPGIPLLSYSSSRQKLASIYFPTCSHGTYFHYMVSCLQVQITCKYWFFPPCISVWSNARDVSPPVQNTCGFSPSNTEIMIRYLATKDITHAWL